MIMMIAFAIVLVPKIVLAIVRDPGLARDAEICSAQAILRLRLRLGLGLGRAGGSVSEDAQFLLAPTVGW